MIRYFTVSYVQGFAFIVISEQAGRLFVRQARVRLS